MFNLLVAAAGEHWEGERLSFGVDRFKEYSGGEADDISIERPATLHRLEAVPALLLYEIGTIGPNARLVRHGRLQNIAVKGSELRFGFAPDPARAYLSRSVILAFSEQLGMHQFEHNRTHWAVKDGDLPSRLLESAVATRPVRTVALVAAEYVDARENRRHGEARDLKKELDAFSPSFEKAFALLPTRLIEHATPELYQILGVKQRTPEARAAIKAVLARERGTEGVIDSWDFSLVRFLEYYGTATETRALDEAMAACRHHLNELSSDALPIEGVATALWHCARSRRLTVHLRREISLLVDRLAQDYSNGWWYSGRGRRLHDYRCTAFAVVALQRLGDDRHRTAVSSAISRLLECQRSTDGAWARRATATEPDVIATTIALEAIRRSNIGDDVSHVLSAAETWLVSAQTVQSGWTADGWSDELVTAIVLEYLERRGAMLPQVDGFLLMARDFFRKAEELSAQGGSNDRRLAAIATVHAVEMFLYGLFERKADLALSAYREDGIDTLGPREALRGLQEGLQRLGVLTAPRRLQYRDQLSSLISKRDGIIHRAHEISTAELDIGMKCARRFIDEMGAQLLSLDLLQ
jgi:hypothetical protein